MKSLIIIMPYSTLLVHFHPFLRFLFRLYFLLLIIYFIIVLIYHSYHIKRLFLIHFFLLHFFLLHFVIYLLFFYFCHLSWICCYYLCLADFLPLLFIYSVQIMSDPGNLFPYFYLFFFYPAHLTTHLILFHFNYLKLSITLILNFILQSIFFPLRLAGTFI